eukprot:scaffold3586_cov404-Prasinococcus_capsulatus_cf.AAC.14
MHHSGRYGLKNALNALCLHSQCWRSGTVGDARGKSVRAISALGKLVAGHGFCAGHVAPEGSADRFNAPPEDYALGASSGEGSDSQERSLKRTTESGERYPLLALVGRANIGKSTLYNRLVGARDALVRDTPGSHMTRDWREGRGTLFGMQFDLIDTPGLEPDARKDDLLARATYLISQRLKKVDLACLLIDTRVGILPQDESAARWLRRHCKDILLLANKCETVAGEINSEADDNFPDLYRLGMAEGDCETASRRCAD